MTIDRQFPERFDPRAFARDLDALRTRVRAQLGPEDLAHLRKIERWGRICTALGYATAWLAPNPLSAALLSQGRFTRWSMVAHHVLHKGYDRVPGVPSTRTSSRFARGRRRLLDWLDWLPPEAWAFEHNRQHHYRLGEDADPDHVEANVDWLRAAEWPGAAKLAVVAFFAGTWKWTYYAPNTLRQLLARRGSTTPERDQLPDLGRMFLRREVWTRSLLPYAGTQFVAIPLLFAPLGPWAVVSALCNSLAAELFTNLHGFLVIVTNHAGGDLYAFDERPRDRADFYLRQVLGSTNFTTGPDLVDFLHGFLNYQIEHHLFPDLPMRQYQRIQPEVKAICEKHGVPYVQESVFARLRKTVAVMTGRATMKRPANVSERSPNL